MSSGRLARTLADLWSLVLLPAITARMPARFAYRCCRWFARGVFGEAARAAAVAASYVPIADPLAFARNARATVLLDVVDLHLSRRRPLDWWPEDVDVSGEWPAGAFVAVTFHYGTGIWLCRALRRSGHSSVFVSARFEREEFAQRPLLHRYGLQRLAEVERIGGEPIAYRPGVGTRLRDALMRNVPVIGLIDVPPRLAPNGQRPISLLGRRASLPDGLLRLAAAARVPVVPCHVEIDFASGRRRVVIGEARMPAPIQPTLEAIAAVLDGLLRAQPAAWMFWREWPGWLRDVAAAGGGPVVETRDSQDPAAEGTLAFRPEDG
jgi:phosphatidylinositol dimannoside acyltransferase